MQSMQKDLITPPTWLCFSRRLFVCLNKNINTREWEWELTSENGREWEY